MIKLYPTKVYPQVTTLKCLFCLLESLYPTKVYPQVTTEVGGSALPTTEHSR